MHCVFYCKKVVHELKGCQYRNNSEQNVGSDSGRLVSTEMTACCPDATRMSDEREGDRSYHWTTAAYRFCLSLAVASLWAGRMSYYIHASSNSNRNIKTEFFYLCYCFIPFLGWNCLLLC